MKSLRNEHIESLSHVDINGAFLKVEMISGKEHCFKRSTKEEVNEEIENIKISSKEYIDFKI